MIVGFAMAFSLFCAWPSADISCAVVALRIESACRVEWLSQPGVTLARLAGLFGMLITSRAPGTLHVLSISYELLGDKVAAPAELRNML